MPEIEPIPEQIPISASKAGLYQWTMQLETTKVVGHVVVRGASASQIGNWTDYDQGYEYWYWGETQTTSTSTPEFRMKLLYQRSPSDTTLVDAIDDVRTNETLAGSAVSVPSWDSGAPLPESPRVFTLTQVTGGPGSYGSLYEEVSFLMPIDGDPVMPTFYTSIEDLYSLFGGDPNNGAPIAEGIEATLSEVEENDPGWPDANDWYWYGRDPS